MHCYQTYVLVVVLINQSEEIYKNDILYFILFLALEDVPKDIALL